MQALILFSVCLLAFEFIDNIDSMRRADFNAPWPTPTSRAAGTHFGGLMECYWELIIGI